MVVAGVADKTTASSVTVEGTCPGMGSSWISFEPYSALGKPLKDATTVRAAAAKFVAGAEGNHLKN